MKIKYKFAVILIFWVRIMYDFWIQSHTLNIGISLIFDRVCVVAIIQLVSLFPSSHTADQTCMSATT